MGKYVDQISGTIPHTNKTIDIPVNGKNLIITGGNGSGKTSFLMSAYNAINGIILTNGACINDLAKEVRVKFYNTGDFLNEYKTDKSIIRYFEDKRLAEIMKPDFQNVLLNEQEVKSRAKSANIGINLEIHLVGLKIKKSLAITEDNNYELASQIDAWFVHFEDGLKKLFEDDSLQLLFDSTNKTFSIKQPNKPVYTFQNLSAGYKAIFDIYADLLMRTEYFEINPTDLKGIVFIDEIDSHLHISLQRLILPFFTESFPQIQFIITTHSPFVLQSVKDAIVFDLGKEEPNIVSEATSIYKVLSQYLNVPVAMPVWAEESLNTILDKYLTKDASEVSLEEMNKALEKAGLAEYMPHAVSKVLEAH